LPAVGDCSYLAVIVIIVVAAVIVAIAAAVITAAAVAIVIAAAVIVVAVAVIATAIIAVIAVIVAIAGAMIVVTAIVAIVAVAVVIVAIAAAGTRSARGFVVVSLFDLLFLHAFAQDAYFSIAHPVVFLLLERFALVRRVSHGFVLLLALPIAPVSSAADHVHDW
jgi:hypothetical protein